MRTTVVTGAASGIGAATARILRERGERVIACDLHDADVIADLATANGRLAVVEGVRKICGGAIDAIVANAGGGPPETSIALNFFGAVATLEGLRPLMAKSRAPRAVVVSSIASLRSPRKGLVEACLAGDEAGAIAIGRDVMKSDGRSHDNPLPEAVQAPLDLYGNSKLALQRWCRRKASGPDWAGAGIPLNIVALGFYDTPAAQYVLTNAEARARMADMIPLKGAFPGAAAEAGKLLAWCVGAENTQMTGQILFADGGFECRARGGSS